MTSGFNIRHPSALIPPGPVPNLNTLLRTPPENAHRVLADDGLSLDDLVRLWNSGPAGKEIALTGADKLRESRK